MSATSTRPVDLARLAAGAVAVARPQWLIRATGSADGTWPRRVTRILGARYAVQSAGGMLVHERWVPEADGTIDLIHAVSMLGFARGFPRHRRLALSSGVVALGFAVVDLTERTRGPR
ncbi:hypothetical protein [Nocardioides marmoribigeumensis]|jgi:hypothetical protein|uniref:Uncharacterized protein n=1 Tax=Nocardioides marmoribigeumensis TaxID=433649 RepID=A0ABU2BXR4_9ACTN|nr:hypothetical protein [Nocardioides marmoribigeumensis]MDR7363200.1 hypothetical protein [Nocardioides marmoribigeumensis]